MLYTVVTFACCTHPQSIVQFSPYITDVPNSPLCLTWCKAVHMWTFLYCALMLVWQLPDGFVHLVTDIGL